MNEQTRVGQMPYEQSSPARMIHVHMREEHVVDRITSHTELIQRREQIRNRVVRARVNERSPSVLPDYVHSRVTGVHIFGVHRENPVRMSSNSRLHGLCFMDESVSGTIAT